MKKVSGIYKIVNKTNDKSYIGSSSDILGTSGRFYNHRRMLKKKIHHCVHLQRAYNKDGLENFTFNIIELVAPSKLLLVEQKYLNAARNNPKMYYNSSFDAGKITMTDEVRSKIGKKKRKWLSNPTHHHMYGKHHSVKTIELIRKNSPRIGKLNGIFGMNRKGQLKFGNKGILSGCKNPRYNHTIYKFVNLKTNERFTGTKYEFSKKTGMKRSNVYYLIKTFSSNSDWRLIPTKTILRINSR